MTYLTRPVFEFQVNWAQQPSKPFLFDLAKLEIGFGTPFFSALQSHVVLGYDFAIMLKTAAEIMEFDAFTAALNGRLSGFWLPAPFLTLKIVGAVSATQFDITDQNLRDTLATHPDVYLWLSRPGLASRPCKISAVVLQSAGIERVTLTAALATSPSPADSAVRLHYVRLAADIERGLFLADNIMKRAVRVVELPHEYEAYETGEQPIYLYHYWADVPMDTHWRFTSFAADVISDNIRFTKFPINHGALKKSMKLAEETLSIEARFDTSHPLALFLPVPFSRPLNVEVLKVNYATLNTTVILSGAGDASVNGDYTQVDATEWSGPPDRSMIFIEADNLWEIYNESAVVLYTCTPENFPLGPWVDVGGGAPAPTATYADTAELLFTGVVRKVADVGDRVKAETDSWASILARKVPPMLISAEDNYDIFDETTGAVPRWRYEITCTVAAVNPEALPPTITLDFDFPEATAHANWITADWFANGFIECGGGVTFAARSILSSTMVGSQLVLELNEPVNPDVGSKVQLTPGYDGSFAARRDKFDDAENFGGFFAVPESNPSLNAMDSNVSQGGKK